MALNQDKSRTGLFAGLGNLSNDAAANSTQNMASKEEAAPESQPSQILDAEMSNKKREPSNPVLAQQPQQAVASSNPNPEINESGHPRIPEATQAAAGNQPLNAPAPINGMPYQPPYGYMVPPGYELFYAQQAALQQRIPIAKMTMRYDRRYNMNPRTYRTTISLTEDMRLAIEEAKRTRKIVSLNDLIYTLLLDYFQKNNLLPDPSQINEWGTPTGKT